jgi:hypothetical protein
MFRLCNLIIARREGGCQLRLCSFNFWFLCILLFKLHVTALWYCSMGSFHISVDELPVMHFVNFLSHSFCGIMINALPLSALVIMRLCCISSCLIFPFFYLCFATLFICCSELSSGMSDPWWWRQYVPLKRRSTIILHGSTSQKTILNIILAAVRTWKLIYLFLIDE